MALTPRSASQRALSAGIYVFRGLFCNELENLMYNEVGCCKLQIVFGKYFAKHRLKSNGQVQFCYRKAKVISMQSEQLHIKTKKPRIMLPHNPGQKQRVPGGHIAMQAKQWHPEVSKSTPKLLLAKQIASPMAGKRPCFVYYCSAISHGTLTDQLNPCEKHKPQFESFIWHCHPDLSPLHTKTAGDNPKSPFKALRGRSLRGPTQSVSATRSTVAHHQIFRLVILLAMVIVLNLSSLTAAAKVTLAWDTVSPAAEKYRLFWRTQDQSHNYNPSAWSGSGTTTSCTIDLLAESTFYSVARATDGAVQSGGASEVQVKVANQAPAANAELD